MMKTLARVFLVGALSGGSASLAAEEVPAQSLLAVPVSPLIPGGAADARPRIVSPVGDDRAAAQRGAMYFDQFNCSGCHAPGGGGGMGPALSNRFFVYGGSTENIFLTISQGRPHGMPAFGSILPQQVIWELVVYVQQLSEGEERKSWGQTITAATPPASSSLQRAPPPGSGGRRLSR